MRLVSLIRHGQAGSRTDYDRLSDLGRLQARRLGEWLVRERTRFDAAVIGGLRRQQETAEIVLDVLGGAGLAPAQIIEDEAWSEFDIDAVFAAIAPRLAESDEGFRKAYKQIETELVAGNERIHREWTDADTAVVESWIAGRFETASESWQDFTARVLNALERLPDRPRIAVFTSATPVGICVANCFDSSAPDRIMNLAGSAFNTNITSLARRNGRWLLGGFNHIAHLDEPELRTHR